MNKFLPLKYLAVCFFAARIDACCAPDTIVGAGSTLQGQTTFGAGTTKPGAAVDNPSLSVVISQAYSLAQGCPTFTYNNGSHFAQDSSAGITQTLLGTVTFGGTETNVDPSLLFPNGPLLQWPVATAGIVVFYNLPNQNTGFNEGFFGTLGCLLLTPDIIAGIFSGKYNFWRELPISNPRINEFDRNLPILVVIRSDSSGTTGALNSYLKNTLGSQWTLPRGNGPFTPEQWQNAFGAKGSNFRYGQFSSTEDIIEAVDSHPGAICYVGYNNLVAKNLLTFGPLFSGGDTKGSAVTSRFAVNVAAVKELQGPLYIPPHPFTFVIEDDSSTSSGYPITTTTNLVTRACQFSQCRAFQLKKFLKYYLDSAQANASAAINSIFNFDDVGLGFAPLSQNDLDTFVTQLDLISYSQNCVSEDVNKCCCTACT